MTAADRPTLLDDLPFPERFEDEAALEDDLATPSRDLVQRPGAARRRPHDPRRRRQDGADAGAPGQARGAGASASSASRASPSPACARSSEGRRHRDASPATCSTATRCASAAEARERRLHGRAQVRRRRATQPLTWAMNVARAGAGGRGLPRVAHRRLLDRLRLSLRAGRSGQGASEDDAADAAAGDYANSCVGRERMFEYFSRTHGTPGRLIRLNYAIDMRYGVLHDVARKVVARRAGRRRDGPRQRDLAGRRQRAGAAAAGALHGADRAAQRQRPRDDRRVRWLARASSASRFGTRAGVVGEEAPTAWLHQHRAAPTQLFGYPRGAARRG